MHPLRKIFNKIFWDEKERKDDYEVVFSHRGAPNDCKTILFNSIKKAEKSTFIYTDKEEEITIPLHRVIIVRNIQNGEIIWRKIKA